MVLGPVLRDVEVGIAGEDVANARAAVDPLDGIPGFRRLLRRRAARPPRHPAAGRTERRRRFARNAPTRILGNAVGERERPLGRRAQPLDGRDLLLVQAGGGGLTRLAGKARKILLRQAGARIGDQLVANAIVGVASGQSSVVNQLDVRRTEPSVPHGDDAGLRAGVIERRPIDHRHACEDAIEIRRIALCHGQRLAPTLGRAHEVELRGMLAVGLAHDRDGGVAHLLVGGMREVDEGLVVEREPSGTENERQNCRAAIAHPADSRRAAS